MNWTQTTAVITSHYKAITLTAWTEHEMGNLDTIQVYMCGKGAKGDWDSCISDLVKNPYGTDI